MFSVSLCQVTHAELFVVLTHVHNCYPFMFIAFSGLKGVGGLPKMGEAKG